MYFLILFFSFLAFTIPGVFTKFLGKKYSIFLSCFFIMLSFLISLFIFYEVCLLNTSVNIKFFYWFAFLIYEVKFGFYFDTLTSFMLIIICGISLLVHLYSIEYMRHDPFKARFFSYLSLFTFFMIFLVTSDNYLQLFLGWEGVGLCSYLLISFWFTRINANKAALKAMIMNRISDVFFIYGIIYLILTFKTTDFAVLFLFMQWGYMYFYHFLTFKLNFYTIICLFFFIGSIGKSAQLGLHTWLADAMEGPTPVSSLLHAATMVTAGVFLILRSTYIFYIGWEMFFFILMFGGFTAFFASFVAFFQYDIKKVIAYSTCSQLGYMFFSCGLLNYEVAFFHLFNHAFFKALLFLSAGSVIHALFDEQDQRRMGSLINFLPFTFFAFVVGSLAIMGFPFLTGFFSKDILLELSFMRFVFDASFTYFLGISSAFFTAVYSMKLLLIVFFNDMNSFRQFVFSSECLNFMFFSIFSLLLCSIFVGYLFSDLVMGWGSILWNGALTNMTYSTSMIKCHFLSPFIKNLPLILSLSGLFFGIYFIEIISYFKNSFTGFFILADINKDSNLFFSIFVLYGKFLTNFGFNAFYFNFFYNNFFNFIFISTYKLFNRDFDKGVFEYIGPFGFYRVFYLISKTFKKGNLSLIFFNIGLMFFFIFSFVLYLGLFIFYSGFLINSGILGFIIFVLIWFFFFWYN